MARRIGFSYPLVPYCPDCDIRMEFHPTWLTLPDDVFEVDYALPQAKESMPPDDPNIDLWGTDVGYGAWWDVLGVPHYSSQETAQAAYRARVRVHHPDAGGDEKTMQRLNRAWREARAKAPTAEEQKQTMGWQ